MARNKEFAVVTLVVTPRGIPLVRNPGELVWKLPGGHGIFYEDEEVAAVRELLEETGINLEPYELQPFFQELRRNRKTHDRASRKQHMFYAFKATLKTWPTARRSGNDGEEVRFFSPWEILRMQTSFAHLRIAYDILRDLISESAAQPKCG